MALTLGVCLFWNNYNTCFLVVLGQRDFLNSSTSSAWPQSELTLGDDSSGLDYMLALSLQSDGESVAGGVEGNLWSGIWDHKIGKTSNTSVNSPFSPPNNNFPNFTTGTSAVQEHDQAGKIVLIRVLWVILLLFLLMILNNFHRFHASLWVLRRAVSWRGPHFASG